MKLFRTQPPVFSNIFMLEVWERFGFYTLQGLFVLFFIQQFKFSDQEAYLLFGAFFALIYALVSLGGYLGDHVLGTRRTILIGLLTLQAGYLMLVFASYEICFYGLSLICVGSGLLKANPSSLLSRCYENHPKDLHAAFTLYYMAINLGSISAFFLGPFFAEKYGYPFAWALSAFGLFLGLCIYLKGYPLLKKIPSPIDDKKLPATYFIFTFIGIILATFACAFFLREPIWAKRVVISVIIATLAVYVRLIFKEKPHHRARMWVALIMIGEGVLFFILYQQMPTSLNLFAVRHTIPTLFGFTINPQSFQALNPIWIVILSPILASLYQKAQARGNLMPLPYKFAIGMFLCALSFLILFFTRYAANADAMISGNWLIASYFFQSTGELLVSALGIAMVAELVPKHLVGFSMGVWFLSFSASGFLGAAVADLTVLPKDISAFESLICYTKVFGEIGLITLGCGLLLWVTAPFLIRVIARDMPS